MALLAGFAGGHSYGEEPADPAPQLLYPNGLAVDSSGDLYVSDIGTHRVLKVLPGGRLQVIAGDGSAGFSGDGGPAVSARLNAPHDIAFAADGVTLLIADTYNHRIRRVTPDGVVTTIAGDGSSHLSGDGGEATAASLNNPQGIAVDGEGNLFIADTFNFVVRRVDVEGRISTVAGSEPGLAGDGGPATQAQLSLPTAVAIATDGTLYIADSGNSRIRRVTPDGVIETIAGFGLGSGLGGAGYSGDSMPAVKSKLFAPADVLVASPSSLYIADSGNNRVRLIAHGIISTIAGSGEPGFSGDGGPLLDARLNTPQKLALDAAGNLYLADRVNHRVRRVTPDGRISTVAGNAEPSAAVLLDSTDIPSSVPAPDTAESR